MIRVCHITSVHIRHDTRIFVKECSCLAEVGYDTNLVVSDGLGNETRQNVKIWDAGRVAGGRARRMLVASNLVLFRAIKLKADIYHFHDPELIPAGIVLRLLGNHVIYDVHEDVARSLENRPWVPSSLRKLVGAMVDWLEYAAARVFDTHMIVTPEICRRFPRERRVLLRNFPIQKELQTVAVQPMLQRSPVFAYVGTVSPDRGAQVMVRAINHPLLAGRARLIIGGSVEPSLLEELKKLDIGDLVTFLGHISRAQIAPLLADARAGLVLLQPIKAHMDAYPVKMFEYMAATLPVIASNHPVWCDLLANGKLALLVDPTNVHEIARAMKKLLDEPEFAERLAQSGAKAVRESYNWESELKQLTDAYRSISTNLVI